MDTKRAYSNSRRAEKAEETGRRILNAMVSLWLREDIRDISLEQVAAEAGVTVRTVMRKYGSKEGLMSATIQQQAAQHLLIRNSGKPADWKEALMLLLQEYELMGEAVIRTLSVEHELPAARELIEHGRQEHLNWCARTFAGFLPPVHADIYRQRLLAFVSATDLYVWKLLRKDRHCSLEDTFGIMKDTIKALIHLYHQNHPIEP